MGKYDDMLDMARPVSKTHPPMAPENRAAQFAPFAALQGYGDAVQETGRRTVRRKMLDETEKEEINRKLRFLQESIDAQHEVSITYFVPDERKTGGSYRTVTSSVQKMQIMERRLLMRDGTVIPIWEITAITGEIFQYIE